MSTTSSCSWQNSMWPQRYRLWLVVAEGELNKEEEWWEGIDKGDLAETHGLFTVCFPIEVSFGIMAGNWGSLCHAQCLHLGVYHLPAKAEFSEGTSICFFRPGQLL